MAGLYIEFEGIDGSGKSTILDMVGKALEAMGIPTLVTREPGSPHAVTTSAIRGLLKEPAEIRPSPFSELFLFMADRAHHIECVVKPALKRGEVVLQDRGVLSTLAYQGYGRGQPIDLIRYMNREAINDCSPDLLIFIDTPPTVARQRVSGRASQTDQINTFEADEFQQRVYDGYKSLIYIEHISKDTLILDGEQSPSDLAIRVVTRILDLL